jgi:hypothetical protein
MLLAASPVAGNAQGSEMPYRGSRETPKDSPPHIADPEVVFTPLKLTLNGLTPPQPDIASRIIGCVRAGPDVDVFWTHYLILFMKHKGKLELAFNVPDAKALAEAGFGPGDHPWCWMDTSGNAPVCPYVCYDGQFVWFPILLAPPGPHPRNDPLDLRPAANPRKWAVVAIDFQQMKAIWFTEKSGVPPGPLVIVPLGRGVACVAGSFSGRTWCARAQIKGDGNHTTKSFDVFYEARTVPPRTNPAVGDASYAYPLRRVLALPAPTPPATQLSRENGATTPAAGQCILLEHGPDYLSIDTVSGAVRLLPSPNPRMVPCLSDSLHLYWVQNGVDVPCTMQSMEPSAWQMGSEQWNVPNGTILCDRDVEVADPIRHAYFAAPGVHGPFRQLRGFVPADGAFPCQLLRSNFYGTLMISPRLATSAVYQVDFPEPLPELGPR